MRKKRIKRLYAQACAADTRGDYRSAVGLFKLVIERSLRKSNYYEFAFQSFIRLGDLYAEAGRQEDSQLLYQMAVGINSEATFIFVQSKLPHYRASALRKKSDWLGANMIDVTDIIKSTDDKHWVYLTRKPKAPRTKAKKAITASRQPELAA